MSEPLAASDSFVFVAPGATPAALPPGAEQDYGKVRDFFTRSRTEVAAEWDAMVKQLQEMLNQLSLLDGAFTLDEVQFQLGFSAEGHLGFIAKAGATGSVTVTFARPIG